MGCNPPYIGGSSMPYMYPASPYAPYPSNAPALATLAQQGGYAQQPQPVPFPTTWQPKAPATQQAAGPKYPALPSASPTYPAPPPPLAAAPAPAAPQYPAAPVVRAKADDDYQPAPVAVSVSLPPPAALGIAPAPALVGAKTFDWNTAHAQLNQLGASFSLTRLPGGAYRMVITLPTSNPGQTHMVEVEAESEASAVTTALNQASRCH
jgi:hypothetical protein